MGYLGKLLIVGIAVGVGYFWHTITQVPPLPKLENKWWGPGNPSKQDASIRPFTINISDEVLDDLAERLEFHGKLTTPLENSGFTYGFNTDYLATVVNYWRNDYKWRERETLLNSFPQFKTHVSGLDMHFLHVKPKEIPNGFKILPLLLLHGWPGSVREFYSLIPLLTAPRKGNDFVFEVIAPSLPGYGFSEGAAKPGLGAAEVAVVMKSLMERIGHKKFYVQGGDWGATIATYMGILFPESVRGLHANKCFVQTPLSTLKVFIGSFWPSLVVDEGHAHKMYPISKSIAHILSESGYMHIQATKPDAIGVALTDSPVGLAAYISDKFSTWTDPTWISLPDGGLTKKFTLDNLLDNIMIYWVTGSITTSMRLYSETFNVAQHSLGLNNIPCHVPAACALFPNEMAYQSEFLLKEKYTNIISFTHMPRGGHFAALEEPTLLADDVWESIGIMQKRENEKHTEKKS